MKKVFALLLAVVMVASMTAPAMASSSEESATCSTMAPYGMCESVGMKKVTKKK